MEYYNEAMRQNKIDWDQIFFYTLHYTCSNEERNDLFVENEIHEEYLEKSRKKTGDTKKKINE